MDEITKQIQQFTTTLNLEVKTDKVWHFLKQLGTAIKRWFSVLLGIILLGSWILLTIQNGNMFTKEALAAGLIITCLLILKGPNTAGKANQGH